MGAKANVGGSTLSSLEKWLSFDVNDGGTQRSVYVSATDITMIHQDEVSNTITYIFYKSGTGTSAISIKHPADVNKLLSADIWKALFKLNSLQKVVTTEVISTIVPTAIKTGCDICPLKVVTETVASGGINPNIPVTILDYVGTTAFTLIDGDIIGDIIKVVNITATGTGTITPTTTAGTYADIEFRKPGQSVDLLWAGPGNGWVILSRNSSEPVGSIAVIDMPIIG